MILAWLATTASAFNLICSGVHVTGTLKPDHLGFEKRNEVRESWVYRIDLEAERWCWQDCTTTQAIVMANDTTIYLEHAEDKFSGINHSGYISRETGEVHHRKNYGNDIDVRRGKCERRPFSGFPKRKF